MSLIWNKLIRPALFALDAEVAHELGMKGLRSGFSRSFAGKAPKFDLGPIQRFGLQFSNPLGMAAGFDKDGVAVNQLADLGFGFVEVGTVTLKAQPGNPKPRVFRLPKDKALINRLGFNNDGAEAVAGRLRKLDRKCVVGVNIGKNKDVPNEEAVQNYLATLEIIHPVADYIAVNISSPNTPNLRELQRSDSLEGLVRALQSRNRELGAKPLLVKIAPDLSEQEIEAAVDICLRHEVSGIIATNTTISRTGLETTRVERIGAGGLSGRPLAKRSTEVIAAIYKYSRSNLPIIGVGGMFDANDAFEKIAAGATLLQAYTGFVYGGPGFAHQINSGLLRLLKERGFGKLDEAVGSGIRLS